MTNEERKLKIRKIDTLRDKVKDEKYNSTGKAMLGGWFAISAVSLITSIYANGENYTKIGSIIAFVATNVFGAVSGYSFKKMFESILKKHDYEKEIDNINDELELHK